jgi:hypothetical protein
MKIKIRNPFAKTQKLSIAAFSVVYVLFFMASGCVKPDLNVVNDGEGSAVDTRSGEGNPFYYYFSEKIHLQEITNRVYLQFAPNADTEKLSSIIGNDAFFRLTPDNNFDKGSFNFAILETKDRQKAPLAAIESYKTISEVVSVSYMYQNDAGKLSGLTDNFIIQLKDAASYAKLQ